VDVEIKAIQTKHVGSHVIRTGNLIIIIIVLASITEFKVVRGSRERVCDNPATNEERRPFPIAVVLDQNGRGERIRTSDLSVPNDRRGKT
jgi:hypothetical protein